MAEWIAHARIYSFHNIADESVESLCDCAYGAAGSDFFFVPGTNDCHLFLLRTEETLDNVRGNRHTPAAPHHHLLSSRASCLGGRGRRN